MSCSDCDPQDIVIVKETEVERVNTLLKTEEYDISLAASDLLKAAPPPPQLLVIVEILSESSVALNWEDLSNSHNTLNTNYDSYTVYVRHVESDIIVQTITGIQLSEADVFGLNELEEYEFWVTAVRNDAESDESNHVFATPESQQPDAPQNFTVTVVQPNPVEGLVRVLFEKSGVGGEVHESAVDQYSSSLFEGGGLTSHGIKDIRVDSVNRWVVVSANDWPDIEQTELDNPSGFSGAGGAGTWNAGLDIDEVNAHKYICDTFESIHVVEYGNITVNTHSLFSSREGRPDKVKVDIDSNILIVRLTSETNRLCSFDMSNPTDNETELLTSYNPSAFDVDLQRHVLYHRGPNNDSIEQMNYDGSGLETLYQHNESIRWVVWTLGNPDWIYFSTGSGLFAFNIEGEFVLQIFETTEIDKFDFEYEVQ